MSHILIFSPFEIDCKRISLFFHDNFHWQTVFDTEIIHSKREHVLNIDPGGFEPKFSVFDC